MDIDRFCYELQYITFPTDPIDLKLTECIPGGGWLIFIPNLELFGQGTILC